MSKPQKTSSNPWGGYSSTLSGKLIFLNGTVTLTQGGGQGGFVSAYTLVTPNGTVSINSSSVNPGQKTVNFALTLTGGSNPGIYTFSGTFVSDTLITGTCTGPSSSERIGGGESDTWTASDAPVAP